jgi:hypothetical protein
MLLRLACLLVLLACLAAAGCGDDPEQVTVPRETDAPAVEPPPQGAPVAQCPSDLALGLVRATNVDCETAATAVGEWSEGEGCVPSEEGMRTACSVEDFRCLSLATGRGFAVSCAAEGRSIAFVAGPR